MTLTTYLLMKHKKFKRISFFIFISNKNDSNYEKMFAEHLNSLQNNLYSYYETEKNKIIL